MNNKPLANLRNLADYESRLRQRQIPATGLTAGGPMDGPINTQREATLNDVLAELMKDNFASTPNIRSAELNPVSPYATLDWSAIGQMGRFVLRNKGPQSVWIAFDINGESVDAYTSDRSVEVQANESWNLDKTAFYKIGLKTAGGSAVVHAIAYQVSAGRGRGAVL